VLSTKEFERDLADLTPDRFEQLVYAVARREHDHAQRLKAPDFGANVLTRNPRGLAGAAKHSGGQHKSDADDRQCDASQALRR
jgi:hypothetical protein